MKKIILSLAALVFLGLPTIASADTFTFNAPATAPNAGSGGPNQFDLDHHNAYTWKINGPDANGKTINLSGKTITGATLTFRNISNWDTTANMLFVHLLDTAKNNGVASFQDAPASQVPVTDINDDFAGTRYANNPLVASGTANTSLFNQSFAYTNGRNYTQVPNFTYTFTANQLSTLSAYFLNGNDFAFGFDPDCHYWNNGITFGMTTTNNTTPTPEPATMTLLGTGLAGLLYRRRRRQQAEKKA